MQSFEDRRNSSEKTFFHNLTMFLSQETSQLPTCTIREVASHMDRQNNGSYAAWKPSDSLLAREEYVPK